MERLIGLDKSRSCIRHILEIINFASFAVLDYFFTSTFTNTSFQCPEYVKQSYEISLLVLTNNLYVIFFKVTM